MVVTFPTGGAPDTLARLFSSKVQLGQPVVVENKPGAGGNIGAEIVAKAKPDGYTLLMALSSISIIPEADKLFDRKPAYTMDQLVPIALVSADPTLLVCRSDRPWKNVKELVEDAKKRPEGISYSSSGIYGTLHMAMEMLIHSAGIKLKHVPYGGAAPALTALLGGHVDMIWANPPEFISQYDAKMVRPIIVAQENRIPQFKDVPTFRESGMDVIFKFYRGVVAPPGLPAEVVAYYEGLLKKLNDTQAWKDQYLAKNILSPGWQGSKEFTKTIYDSEVVFEETLKSLGLIK
jgi:tripartite-type tricarboxylate transporter receptor subunit TctC